jgi:N-acetylmuramoyl-L-alanine amidase
MSKAEKAGEELTSAKKKAPSKFLYILDPGHGGTDPKTGEYVTSGKRSPKFEDGSCFYEGVNNRDNINRLKKALDDANIDSVDIVDSYLDISLKERVRRANDLGKSRPCVYISMHSDAHGMGDVWMPGQGISVYTSVGQTNSDFFANEVIQELEYNFEKTVKWRFDKASDGDKDKEAHFYVLKHTTMPAILIEAGFHTHKLEVVRMMSEEWKTSLIDAIVQGIKNWEDQHED